MFSLRVPAAGLCAVRTANRTFASTRVLPASKESSLHQEGRGEEAEKAKEEQLKAQKQGKGEWKDVLASDSESAVKADRDDKKSIGQMQKETASKAEQEKK